MKVLSDLAQGFGALNVLTLTLISDCFAIEVLVYRLARICWL
jgi:hypothetical protein